MATHTKFRPLSNIEFLNAVQGARAHSPVIEELAQRLENYVMAQVTSSSVTCPHCEESLTVTMHNGEVNVKSA